MQIPHRYVLDFDGVIVDSVDEAALTAYNAICDALLIELSKLPQHYLEIFRTNRSIVGPAAEFLPFAKWCAESSQSCLKNCVAKTLTRAELIQAVAEATESHQHRTERFFPNGRS